MIEFALCTVDNNNNNNNNYYYNNSRRGNLMQSELAKTLCKEFITVNLESIFQLANMKNAYYDRQYERVTTGKNEVRHF